MKVKSVIGKIFAAVTLLSSAKPSGDPVQANPHNNIINQQNNPINNNDTSDKNADYVSAKLKADEEQNKNSSFSEPVAEAAKNQHRQNATSNQEQAKVTSSATIGKINNKKLSGNIGSFIRQAGFGAIGAALEHEKAPNWVRRAGTVVAAGAMLSNLFSQRTSFFSNIRNLASNFAEGEAANVALNGKKSKFNLPVLIIASMVLKGQMDMGKMMSGGGGMENIMGAFTGGMPGPSQG